MTIDQRIADHYADLTPQEQRAADVIMDQLGDLAVYSLAELAAMSEVSKATVSRLFRRLGFGSFNAFKEEVRSLRRQGMPLGSLQGNSYLSAHVEREQENLRRCIDSFADGRLDRAADAVANAARVLVIGHRNSYPVALHLRQQLVQARGNVLLSPQPGQTLGEELVSVGPGDAIILIGFRRRPRGFPELVKAAAASGAATVLLADGTARRYASAVTCWLECPVDSIAAFDSYATAMGVVSLLANRVLDTAGQDGRRRISRIAASYAGLGELETD